MRRYFSALLDLVYPPRCPVCARLTTGPLCEQCLPQLPLITGPICSHCGSPTSVSTAVCRHCENACFHFTWARSAWAFSGPGRELIYDLKYRNNAHLSQALAAWLVPLIGPSDIISWVPLTRSKKWARGYNQAELLARHLARSTDLPPAELLRRNRHTADQNRLTPVERRQNVRGAFEVRADAVVTGLNILLVDDVFTTGATVSECAAALSASGARAVHVVTLARTL